MNTTRTLIVTDNNGTPIALDFVCDGKDSAELTISIDGGPRFVVDMVDAEARKGTLSLCDFLGAAADNATSVINHQARQSVRDMNCKLEASTVG